MIFELEHNKCKFYLEIEQQVLQKINLAMQEHFPREYGGVLLGNYSADGKKATIIETIVPRNAKSSTTFFERSADYINEVIGQIYEKSKGAIFYLGEWHSHPNIKPIPSSQDYQSMVKLVIEDNINISNPILLIIGGNKDNHMINVYLFIEFKFHRYQLTNP